jgi:hypothetical protein
VLPSPFGIDPSPFAAAASSPGTGIGVPLPAGWRQVTMGAHMSVAFLPSLPLLQQTSPS